MAVSYEEAREIVRDRFEPGWTHGTFCLDDRYITENDEFYVFSIGAREHLVDGDINYAVPGAVTIVYKSDGRIDSRASVDVAMDPTVHGRPNPNPTLMVLSPGSPGRSRTSISTRAVPPIQPSETCLPPAHSGGDVCLVDGPAEVPTCPVVARHPCARRGDTG